MQTIAGFVQSPVTTVGAWVNDNLQYFAGLRTAQNENDALKQKVQELEVEVQSKQDLASENTRLKDLLQLKQESKYQVLPSRVIGRDSSTWFNAAFINRGSADGVKLYMPVVSNGGLIGRITAVSPLSSQVTMITDERSGVGAIIGEIGTSQAQGVVSGVKDKGILEMRYVPGSTEVKEGDPVFTSGQDGIYPAGLKLGEIAEVRVLELLGEGGAGSMWKVQNPNGGGFHALKSHSPHKPGQSGNPSRQIGSRRFRSVRARGSGLGVS